MKLIKTIYINSIKVSVESEPTFYCKQYFIHQTKKYRIYCSLEVRFDDNPFTQTVAGSSYCYSELEAAEVQCKEILYGCRAAYKEIFDFYLDMPTKAWQHIKAIRKNPND